MSDSVIETSRVAAPDHLNDVTKFFEDASTNPSSGDLSSRMGRVGEVTGKGLLATPEGIGAAALNFVKPENWGNDALMIGSSAAFGAALRVALPESGALKTVVGVGMGVMFLKDAAMPVINSWTKVWNDDSQKTMADASKEMGNGLGDFAVQGGISVLAAGAAAKFTPGIANKISPEGWTKIENWKATNLGGAASVPLAEGAARETFTARPAATRLELSKPGLNLDIRTGAPEAVKPVLKDLSPDQLRSILEKSRTAETTRIAGGQLGRFGVRGSDGNFHTHEDVVNLLLAGKDPSVEAAGLKTAQTLPLAKADLTKPNSLVITERAASAHMPESEAADVAGRRRGGGADKTKTPAETGHDVPAAKVPAKPTDATTATDTTKGAGSDKGTDASKILNAANMLAQAKAIKASLGTISDQDGLIMDAMNRNLGAIDVRTNPNVRPLRGYDTARDAAFALAQQVGTDPENFMQVNNLYERFAAGALQSGTMESSDIAAHVARMDQYALENFNTYRDNIIKAGIDPDVALAQKPSAPLVEGTSDVQQVGVDQNGQPVYAHEGPHTMRAIYGPNGEPVWPLDTVKTPIREIGMRGVNTSGIYGHEYMHDQFGHTAEFDPAVRDAKLGDAAAKAWGDDANKMVDLPNGGVDPQKVLLDSVVRKMAKVDPAEQDAFLTENLGLDQQSRVMRGARAADQLLGQVGRATIQVPGSGPMPLEVFIGNIAAMADARTPTEILAEMQGKGTPAATEQTISANIDKMLGQNGQQQLPLADGSKITIKDAVMKVSESTRNPKFQTYDKPLPAQMSNADILVNVAKAWADETFADWGAAAESGQTAAPYFQALSKDGMLRGATVTGQSMRSPTNELGIEAHPTDKLRPRYQAALVRALATINGQHDQVLLDWADALEQYSRDASKPGPVMLPTMDSPGKAIQIPEEVFDKFIPALVDAQLNTPLPRLQGKTLFDILPDLRKNFRINQGISDSWVSAIEGGKAPETLPFDAPGTKMTHVYGAGQLTFLKLVSGGMDPIEANDAVNKFSDFFGDKIVRDRASAPVTAPVVKPLQFAAMGRGTGDLGGLRPLDAQSRLGMSALTGGDGSFDASGTLPTLTQGGSRIGQGARWLGQAAMSPTGTAAMGAYVVQDLVGLHKVQQEVLKQNQ